MTARTVDILSQRAHWENRLDYRDYRVTTTCKKYSAITLGNAIQVSSGVVTDNLWTELVDHQDIGFVLFYEGLVVDGNSSLHSLLMFFNGVPYGHDTRFGQGFRPAIFAPAPIDIRAFHDIGGNYFINFNISYIPKEKYNLEHPMTWPTTEKPGSEKRKLPKGIADSD